jgi:VanZ family protein
MSTQTGGTDHSAHYLRRLLNALSPEFARSLSDFQFFCLHYSPRKAAHVFEYMVLGLLAFRAVQWGRPCFRWMSVVAGVALPMACSVLDETHQAFVPGRSSSATDVLINVSGAAMGMLCICVAALNRGVERRAVNAGRCGHSDLMKRDGVAHMTHEEVVADEHAR